MDATEVVGTAGLTVMDRMIFYPVSRRADGRVVYVPISEDLMTFTDRGVAHAVKPTLKRTRRRTLDAVCGRRAYPVLLLVDETHALVPVWPPYKHIEGMDRCEACWQETGRRRPHRMWKGVAAA